MIIVFNWRLCSPKALFHEKTKLIHHLVVNYPNIIIIIIVIITIHVFTNDKFKSTPTKD